MVSPPSSTDPQGSAPEGGPAAPGPLLGIDTATDDTAVAIAGAEGVVFESLDGPGPEGRPSHSRSLLPAVEEAVERAGGWESLAGIAVGLGPGTFTGLRIGIATARGLAMGSGLPVVGVPTLDALALEIAGSGKAELVVPVIDARRQEVFFSLHGPEGAPLEGPAVAAPQSLAERLGSEGASAIAAGSGALRFRQLLEAAGVQVPGPDSRLHRVAGRRICEIGWSRPDPGSGAGPEPIYLREPDAKRWIQRDRGAAGPPGR